MLTIAYVESQQKCLKQLLSKTGLMKTDGTCFPVSFSPYFIEQSRYNSLANKCELVLSAIEKILRNFKKETYIQQYFFEFSKYSFLFADPEYLPWVQLARFDLAEDPLGNFYLMEPNCAQPGGAALMPMLKDVFEKLDILEQYISKNKIIKQTIDQEDLFIREISNTFREVRKKEPDHLDLGLCRHNAFKGETPQFIQVANKLGCQSDVFYVDEVATKDNKLFLHGRELDFIHHKFDLITEENGQQRLDLFVENPNEVRPYIEALKENLAVFINPIISMTVGESKKIIPLLQDKNVHHLFTPQEIQAIEELCPLTYVLQDKHPESIEKEHVQKNKDQYVLKYAYDTRARGVFVGKGMSQAEWEQAIDTTTNIPSIVQEYIGHKTELVWPANKPEQALHRSNLAMYLIKGKAAGILCRATEGYKTNFYSSGIFRPAYIIC